jgi:hypothetical protein
VPVTGRAYQRLKWGPAPVEMPPIHGEMLRDGLIEVERVDFGEGIIEHRTRPLTEPRLHYFNESDIEFVERAIAYYWDKTGAQASDDSHGVAWRTRFDGEAMPYELAYLAYDQRLRPRQRARILEMAKAGGWNSL